MQNRFLKLNILTNKQSSEHLFRPKGSFKTCYKPPLFHDRMLGDLYHKLENFQIERMGRRFHQFSK
jgi:hypothetical protein